jgi:hypothetical protein
LIYKGVTFRAFYAQRQASPEELKLQRKVERRRRLVVELDMWLHQNVDSRMDLEAGTTAEFLGWVIEDKQGLPEAIVPDAHAYIDQQKELKIA